MSQPASAQRYVIVGITSMAALWMYIDRVCLSTLADKIQKDLIFDDDQKAVMLGAFFFAYALFQLPTGSLADRFGQRVVLTACIAGWSIVTAMTGFVQGFVGLLIVRLLLGAAEAGAYPAAAGLVKNWAAPTERGRFSSFVALGGRGGGAVAPFITAVLAILFVSWGPSYWTVETTTKVVVAGVEQERVEVLNWRAVFVFFGICGLVVAALFWFMVRNHPPDYVPPQRTTAAAVPFSARLRRLIYNRNMTFFAVVQLCTNVGWAPLVTLLPSYLNEQFQTPLKEIGAMQSTALTIGCFGMVLGGFVTDYLRGRLGPRWGRSLPISLAMAGCVVCFLLVPQMPTAWMAIIVLGTMAFLVDLSNPSIWAFAQDVGGKTVGAALGWGNMWGNLGAAASPFLLTRVKTEFGWNAAFLICAACFAVAALAGFLLNASRTLDDQPTESRND